ncbi:hypothetical protein AB0B99_31205, partial [Micromonospora haikouensis]
MNTTILRKSVLGIAGLAFAGGLAAGPLNHATTTDTGTGTVDARPVAAVQADKPASVDTAKLIPHGVQGTQSRIDLDAEQTANAKAI